MAVQNRLSAKFTATSDRKKDEQGALVEYYSVADQNASMGRRPWPHRARQGGYGGDRAGRRLRPPLLRLRPAQARRLQRLRPQAIDWLADAEIKISYAVLDYATRRARRPHQAAAPERRISIRISLLPDPTEVIESIAIRSDPAAYLRSFQPDQPQFEALRQKLIAAARRESRAGRRQKPANSSPTARC